VQIRVKTNAKLFQPRSKLFLSNDKLFLPSYVQAIFLCHLKETKKSVLNVFGVKKI